MSTIIPMEYTCSICGTTNVFSTVGSTNMLWSPDLDTRPGEMQRSTMPYWVQECPCCGYVSQEISNPSRVTRAWLQSEKYCECNGFSFTSSLAKRFYKQHLISLEDGNVREAFFAVLHAAWASDDEFDFGRAYTCRRQALSLSNQLLETNPVDSETIHLIRMDLMRRTELYDQLISEYWPFHFKNKMMRRIAKFQIRRARAKDNECYQSSDTKWSLQSLRNSLHTWRYKIRFAKAEKLLKKNMNT